MVMVDLLHSNDFLIVIHGRLVLLAKYKSSCKQF